MQAKLRCYSAKGEDLLICGLKCKLSYSCIIMAVKQIKQFRKYSWQSLDYSTNIWQGNQWCNYLTKIETLIPSDMTKIQRYIFCITIASTEILAWAHSHPCLCRHTIFGEDYILHILEKSVVDGGVMTTVNFSYY